MKHALHAVALVVFACSTRAQPIELPHAPAGVETFVHADIKFARVRANDVQPFIPTNGPLNRPIGAGSWDFSIARTELTQQQWVDFMAHFNAVPVPQGRPWTSAVEVLLGGGGWIGPGMYFTEIGPLGRPLQRVTPEGAMRPLAGAGWLGGALFCNWLQSGQQDTIDALINGGSYDLSRFDLDDGNTWPTGTRLPEARYWMPTYDQWALASFYDPSRHGEGHAGWWTYLNRRDRLGIPGPPGAGETSANWDPDDPNYNASRNPIASYPNSQSPWGLLDTSGTFREQLDDQWPFGLDRLTAGSTAGPFVFPDLDAYSETPGWYGTNSPVFGSPTSLRIATSIPSVPAWHILGGAVAITLTRRRR